MSKKIDIKSLINTLKTSNFLFECAMPLGYTAGLPVLQIVNDRLCLKIPYLKYKVTGEDCRPVLAVSKAGRKDMKGGDGL